MKFDTYNLYYKTQTQKFLTIAVLAILSIGITISIIINTFYKKENHPQKHLDSLYRAATSKKGSQNYEKELIKTLSDPKLDLEEFALYIEGMITIKNSELSIKTIAALKQAEIQNQKLQIMRIALQVSLVPSDLIELEKETLKVPPLDYSYRLLAFLYSEIDKDKAFNYLLQETTLKSSAVCKQRVVFYLIKNNQIEKLKELENNSDYKEYSHFIKNKIYSSEKNWLKVLTNTIEEQLDIKFNGMFYLTLLTGAIWFGIWLHTLRPQKIIPSVLLGLFAFALGIFSTSLTLFAIELERYYTNISEGNSLMQGILYYIFSVGLREEFLKTIVFIPLIPILIKRKNQLEWLIMAGLVGLGFAVEENLNYFTSSQDTSILGRFLTANFLHVGLTALVGESLCYYFYNRSYGVQNVLETFSKVVLIHGLYDAFISVPQLYSLSFISTIAFYYIAQQFFKRVRTLRDNSIEPISLTTHFILGLAILFVSTYGYFSFQDGALESITLLVPTFIELLITIYIFLLVMPNSTIKLD